MPTRYFHSNRSVIEKAIRERSNKDDPRISNDDGAHRHSLLFFMLFHAAAGAPAYYDVYVLHVYRRQRNADWGESYRRFN